MANLDEVYHFDDRTTAFKKHERGILVCLAGPGTGKTYSLLERTTALTNRKFEPDSICYLTFIKEISNAFIDDSGMEAKNKTADRLISLWRTAVRRRRG
jgi:hypothetical protein